MRTRTLVGTLAPLLLAPAAHAQYAITSFTIDGGGGTSTGGPFALSGTIGQHDAGPASGPMTGGAFALTGGFWPGAVQTPSCIADFNGDGNLDPDDLGDFINCYFAVPPCPGADFNGDGNIDPDDLGDFINAYFSGC